MNEELTRVFEKYELEAMIEYYKNNDCSRKVAIELATALLEERARPKVWAFAPEWANAARVSFFVNDRNDGHSEVFSGTYTRELPKTRTRIMAEEIASAHISNKDDLIDIIEQTINAHMEELKGEA